MQFCWVNKSDFFLLFMKPDSVTQNEFEIVTEDWCTYVFIQFVPLNNLNHAL